MNGAFPPATSLPYDWEHLHHVWGGHVRVPHTARVVSAFRYLAIWRDQPLSEFPAASKKSRSMHYGEHDVAGFDGGESAFTTFQTSTTAKRVVKTCRHKHSLQRGGCVQCARRGGGACDVMLALVSSELVFAGVRCRGTSLIGNRHVTGGVQGVLAHQKPPRSRGVTGVPCASDTATLPAVTNRGPADVAH